MILHRLRREGQNIAGAIFSCPASTFKGPSLLSTSKLMDRCFEGALQIYMLEWKKYRRANPKQFSSTNLELQHRQALFCWVPWIIDFADPKLPFTIYSVRSFLHRQCPAKSDVSDEETTKKIYLTIKFHEQKIYQICDKTNSRQLPPPQQALIDPGPEIDSKMSGQYGWICWQIVE